MFSSMSFGRVFFVLLGLLSIRVSARPRDDLEYVVHERRTTPIQRWEKRDRVPGDHLLSMTIALAQPNLAHGHDLLMEISHPDSPRYGQHFTHAEIIEIFAPADEAVAAVHEWLHSFDIPAERIALSQDRTRIEVSSFVDEAEDLLHAEYYAYEHWDTGKVTIASDAYHLPTHIQDHIEFVTPGTTPFGAGRTRRSGKEARGGLQQRKYQPPPLPVVTNLTQKIIDDIKNKPLEYCDKYITPPCIKEMYNITDNTLPPNAANRLSIFEFGDFYSSASLTQFFAAFGGLHVDGAHDLKEVGVPRDGTESDLDLQISYPIIWPQEVKLYQSDDDAYTLGLNTSEWDGAGFINNFLNYLDADYCESITDVEKAQDPQYPHNTTLGWKNKVQCGVDKASSYVISISYGEQEDDLPVVYQQRQCTEFMKLGMRGISVVVASGDSGVAARATDDGNANGCLGTDAKVFNPDYPATCPYVTSVGATYLPSDASYASDSEVAVTSFPSGGGFSNIYAIPDYQADAVATYLNDHTPKYLSYSSLPSPIYSASYSSASGIYNSNGRGYPDLSAVGDNIVIFSDEAPTLVGGTSASAPVFASILTRINEVLLSKGKKPVGFVNPTLYANPQAFHDMTTGSNPGCGTKGFSAANGWDPVTGLGTPNFPALLTAFCKAQGETC
ncbi:peptidase S8/S53 domain-containing protein [Mycena galopus ATCC 62051]|nr:peptidase S8/S53 domain-containing protein [Mycena galopus ATCC 62051]